MCSEGMRKSAPSCPAASPTAADGCIVVVVATPGAMYMG